jgi:hypothetical protein
MIPPRHPHAPHFPHAARALLGCSLLLVAFATLSYTAVLSKSATYDEPLHAVGAWLHLWKHDFRVNPEDPPLWHYWAALPNGPGALKVDLHSQRYARVADDIYNEWPFVVDTLYRTSGNNADAFIDRSRFMMVLVGIGLGALVGWWSWRLGGAVAAVVSTAAFALDPNFLGHAALVKNDVASALAMLACTIAVWRAGRRLTWNNMLAVGLLCAAAINIKFSGLLIGPIGAALLIARALLPAPWSCFGAEHRRKRQKLLAALAVCLTAAAVSYVGTWGTYGFRFRPGPDPNAHLNVQRMIEYTAYNELLARSGGTPPTTRQAQAWRPGPVTAAILTMEKHHLLPQAWLTGLLYTYQSALVRQTFLLGDYSITGWWYYFPIAMAVKSPLALIVAALLSLAVGITVLRRSRLTDDAREDSARSTGTWTTLCLLLPPAMYLLFAMRSNLNLGLRHVLAVYPFVYIAIGLAAAYGWKHRPRLARIVTAALALALAGESLAAFPDYIAFFNAAAGGSRGGLLLLGDSNLDWGQDLKQVAQWQQDHPNVRLYLCYFGTADPWAYGIKYINVAGGYPFGPTFQTPSDPGVIAISATNLQGIYGNDEMRQAYSTLRRSRPLAVLGGTIYLYDWPPKSAPPVPAHAP